MNENFFGQTAVYVSSPYRAEASCQVSAKSLERFSGKSADGLTDGPTIPSLTSTDVENCQRGQVTTCSTSVTVQPVEPVQPHKPVKLD